jgi:hypothetical protein
MRQKRILVPTRSAIDWKTLLAEPEKHWKPGYSAFLTAEAWENACGIPPEIVSVFNASEDDYFTDVELALAIPEYKVALKGGTRPSQNDVFALLRSETGLTAVTIEAKARENFGPTLAQWRKKVSAKGYQTRLQSVLADLGLEEPIPDSIRYQLLHRTASAIIEAKRFHCRAAAMIVQSFVELDFENHFEDYVQFLRLYGVAPVKGHLAFLASIDGIRLYSAWISSITPESTNTSELSDG